MSTETILNEFGKKLVDDVRTNLVKKQQEKAARYGTPYNHNSKLVASVNFEVFNKSGSLMFELTMADYFEYVDRGRKPGGVSEAGQKKIAYWIKVKGLNPVKIMSEMRAEARSKAGTKGAYKPRKKLTFEKATKAFTYLVARKLSRFGYDGNFFYSEVILDGRMEQLKIDLEKELNEEIELLIK
jgi:hypothetical protein